MTAEDAWAQGIWRGDFEFVQPDGTVLVQGRIVGEDIPNPDEAVMPEDAPDLVEMIWKMHTFYKTTGNEDFLLIARQLAAHL